MNEPTIAAAATRQQENEENKAQQRAWPRLFFVKLPLSAKRQTALEEDVRMAHFRRPWFLRVATTTTHTNTTTENDKDNNGLPENATYCTTPRPNDIVVWEDCFTGAGEFEGVRFVGTPTAPKDPNRHDGDTPTTTTLLPLLRAAVEQPMFPHAIVDSIGQQQQQQVQNTTKGNDAQDNHQAESLLRLCYEYFLEYFLQRQESVTLADVLGGLDVVEEFWTNPDQGPDLAAAAGDEDLQLPPVVIDWHTCSAYEMIRHPQDKGTND